MKVFDGFFEVVRSMEFANPHLLWLLLLIVPYVVWQIWKRRKMQVPLTVTTTQPFENAPKTLRYRLRHLPLVLRCLALCFLIVALARPQSSYHKSNIKTEGIDIVIALDVSGSMQMMDFTPTRLEACKDIAAQFVDQRPNDRLGLVLYAGEAYTQCPLTIDHTAFKRLLAQAQMGPLDDGTAIGDGLGTAINRLRESKAKSKVIILLSDGVNNTGYMDPRSTAAMAKELGIKVYTISCGTNGKMSKMKIPGYGVQSVKTEIDEALLKFIAEETGGTYFVANNKTKLKQIYDEIDKMEKTIIDEEVIENKGDEFLPFLLIALFLFLFELVARYTFLRTNP